jgi:molybdate transport system substrate-binding protein
MQPSRILAAGVAFVILFAWAVAARAAELKVISGPATAVILARIASQFEQETGYTLTKKGGVTGVLKHLIESGEPFDVALIPAPLMDNFAKQGKIAANENIRFVRVGMGVAVRAGAAKPDIHSVAAFKQALLNAKSVTFVPTGESAHHFQKVLKDLGIAEQMKTKFRPHQTVPECIQSIASGEVELYVSLTNIIASAKGIELAGALPPELQHYLVISAGMSADTKESKEAEALIKLLTSKPVEPVIRAAGLEPVGQ